jgi:parallel beta-helix repeat protein
MDSMDNFQERFETLERRTQMVEQRLRWWRGIACGVIMLLGALGIAFGSVTPAPADVINCGDVLGPGGRFELEHDLDCPSPPPFPAITVRDRAILDLKGHIVTCHNFAGCIVLTGTGAQLLNGAVQGGLHESIRVEGNGGHIVRNVTSLVVDGNVAVVESDHNQLINVMAESGISPAFIIIGNNNRLTNNIARCFSLAFDDCIQVSGNNNHLIDNFVTSTSSFSFGGFAITGNKNVLQGNRAIGNAGPGIVITGTGNTLRHNTALRNSPDLEDTSGDCAHNTWEQNTFRTSDPECIQNPSPSARDVAHNQ